MADYDRRYAEVLLLSEAGVPALGTRAGLDEALPLFLALEPFARGRLKIRARSKEATFDAWAPGAGRCETEDRPPEVFARLEHPPAAFGLAFDQVFHLAVATDVLGPEAEAARRALIRHVATKSRLVLAAEQEGPWGHALQMPGAYARAVQEAATSIYYGGMGALPDPARWKGAWKPFDPQ